MHKSVMSINQWSLWHFPLCMLCMHTQKWCTAPIFSAVKCQYNILQMWKRSNCNCSFNNSSMCPLHNEVATRWEM